ncbi:restriction endonuclease subunit S [Azospirillum sp. TSO22-1]|uniref:restriction endonuclease subunit S n=1 Tax=Azospirillum sp. TSO22-1 TaxID=716789 RepID=UPI000D645705|nr:restriction endonuclease subunit S [Azospirillum sp. TSO22-1]
MSGLPEHWVKAPIGDICDLINGRAFKPSEWSENGLPIIRIQNLNNQKAKYNYFAGAIDDRHHVESGDLLFAWSGTPGTSFGAHIWEGGSAVLNQHIFKVLFNRDLVDSSFLKFAINDTLDELIAQAHGGVGLRHITKGTLERTEISLPPLKEQRRIAEALNIHLARISDARADLRSALEVGAQYKDAVLKDAFPDHAARHGQAIQFVRLADLVDEGPSNGWSPKAGPDATGALSLKLTATTSGYLRLDEAAVKRVYERPAEDSRYWLKPGDLLVQRANALEHLGATAIYDGPTLTYIYPDLMMRLRIADTNKRRYLWRYLNSACARRFFRERATGTAGNMPKINSETLRNLPVPIPAAGDFGKIADRIERDFSDIDSALRAAEDAADFLDRLEKLLLKQALCGKLVAPDQADGQATELLEQIRNTPLQNLSSSLSYSRSQTSHRPQGKKQETNLANKMRTDVAPDHLTTTLIGLGGAASPRELWRKSEMMIDEFYKQLREEMKNGRLVVGSRHDELVVQDAP